MSSSSAAYGRGAAECAEIVEVPLRPPALSALALPSVAPRPARMDVVGALGLAAGLALAAYGLSAAAVEDPVLRSVLVPLLAGGLLVAGTLAYERRTTEPMRPLGLLRGPVRSASLVAAALGANTSPAMVLAVLYVQDLLRLSPGRAAWLFPALNLSVIGGSLAGPALIRRAGCRRTAVAGLVLVAAAACC